MGVVIVVWGERESAWKKVRMCHKQWGAKEGRKRIGERKDERRVLVLARSLHTKIPWPPGHGDMDARTVRTTKGTHAEGWNRSVRRPSCCTFTHLGYRCNRRLCSFHKRKAPNPARPR